MIKNITEKRKMFKYVIPALAKADIDKAQAELQSVLHYCAVLSGHDPVDFMSEFYRTTGELMKDNAEVINRMTADVKKFIEEESDSEDLEQLRAGIREQQKELNKELGNEDSRNLC